MNLEQVAKHARVSTATVSRVLNNAGTVKNSTRARVLKAVEELRYHPNLHARSLAGGRSRTLGMIISNMENPFFFDIFRSVEEEARKSGYEVLVANTDYRSEQLVRSIRLMMGRRVAGMACVVSEMEPEIENELAASPMPVVFYDAAAPHANATNIRVNYQRGMEKVIDYLYSLGHRKLGFVGHHSNLGPLNERVHAVMDAAGRYASLEVQTAAGADSLEGGRLAARELLDTGYNPTALVCVNDITAAGALRELRERGIRVPEDISVTGFDNVKLSEFCYPALTTVHIPRDRIGKIICEAAIPGPGQAALEGKDVMIDPEFMLRDSTAVAPSSATR